MTATDEQAAAQLEQDAIEQSEQDAIDATTQAEQDAIDALMQQSPAAGRDRPWSRELAAEEPKGPAKDVRPAQPENVWTLRAMQRREPIKGVVEHNGMRADFWFQPEALTTEYAQVRFDRASQHFRDEEAGVPERYTMPQVMTGYADIVYEMLRGEGCSWPLFEEIEGPDGRVLRDEAGNVRLRPLPVTRDNVSRLNWEQLSAFLSGATDAMRGEVRGQR